MQTVIFIPGLGDMDGYIKWLTRRWPQKYGLQPIMFHYGWDDPLKTYEQKYDALAKLIAEHQPAALVGISAGGSVALNMLRRNPEQVSKVVTIAAPCRLRKQDLLLPRLAKHPLLRRSIDEVQTQGSLAERVMTLRPLYDNIVNPVNVPLPGAVNHRIWVIGHIFGIPWILWRRARTISDFLRD